MHIHQMVHFFGMFHLFWVGGKRGGLPWRLACHHRGHQRLRLGRCSPISLLLDSPMFIWSKLIIIYHKSKHLRSFVEWGHHLVWMRTDQHRHLKYAPPWHVSLVNYRLKSGTYLTLGFKISSDMNFNWQKLNDIRGDCKFSEDFLCLSADLLIICGVVQFSYLTETILFKKWAWRRDCHAKNGVLKFQ